MTENIGSKTQSLEHVNECQLLVGETDKLWLNGGGLSWILERKLPFLPVLHCTEWRSDFPQYKDPFLQASDLGKVSLYWGNLTAFLSDHRHCCNH